jgi:hypothetical protein
LAIAADRPRYFRDRPREVFQYHVEVMDFGRPAASRSRNRHAFPEPAFAADDPAQPRHFAPQLVLVQNRLIEGRRDLSIYAVPVRGQPDGKIAVTKRKHCGKQARRPGVCGAGLS